MKNITGLVENAGRGGFAAAAMVAALVAGCSAATPNPTAPTITVAEGTLKGGSGDGVDRFLGVPYAAPPTGDMRWKPPGAPVKWDAERDSAALRSKCPQNGWTNSDEFRDEDCLFLNIYRPQGGAEKKPVIVWVHGGAYTRGSSQDLDGSNLAKKTDAIVVSVNYRLGVFGFLAHPALDKEAGGSGNYGLMDQQAALRWVKANIDKFGGDPAGVTMMGQSAGGGSTWIQTVSPGGQGLFSKAIVMSGGGNGNYRTSAEAGATGSAAALAGKLGCDGVPDVLACLRAKSTDEVVEAGGMTPAAGWGPVIDGTVLTKPVGELVAAGVGSGIPVISGIMSQDAGFSVQRRRFGGTPAWTAADYEASVREAPWGEAALKAYPASAFPTADDAYIVMTTDISACNTGRINRIAAPHHAVYAYEFDDREAPSTIFHTADFQRGAYHTFELPYFFQSSYPHDVSPTMPALTDPQKALSDRIVADIKAFVWAGKPAAAEWTTDKVLQWKPAGDVAMSIADYEKAHKCAFWDGVRAQ